MGPRTMRSGARWARALCLLGWLIVIASGHGHAADPLARPTEPLSIETATGVHAFEVEVARTPEHRRVGLMFRAELAANGGMLFDFGLNRPVAMWMKNTFISLDMLFIDATGCIVRIEAETTPFSEEHIASGAPVRAVLELTAGRAAAIGAAPGDRVSHPMFEDTADGNADGAAEDDEPRPNCAPSAGRSPQ